MAHRHHTEHSNWADAGMKAAREFCREYPVLAASTHKWVEQAVEEAVLREAIGAEKYLEIRDVVFGVLQETLDVPLDPDPPPA